MENGPSPNYRRWFEQLKSAIESKWQELSRFLLHPDYDYYIPPEIPLPTAEEEAADALTGGYRRSDIKALQVARRIYMAKNESDKTPCFVFILKTLSEESIEGMGKLENYDQEIKDSRNPALLLDAIELVHSTKFSSTPVLMNLNVENQYLALRQYKDESLLLYKRRIETTLKLFDAVGMERPSLESTVNHMMKSCNQERYKSHIKILLDKVREDGKPFPASTHELYVYLVGRVPDPRGSAAETQAIDSAFVTVDHAKGRKKPGGASAGGKAPTRPCILCPDSVADADKLHWQSDCPYLEQFHQMMLKETGKPKSKDKDERKKKVAYAAVEEEDEVDAAWNGDEDDDIDAAWLTFSETVAAAVSDKRLGSSDILLDNAATVCIINNSELLGTISDLAVPRVVSGVGGTMTIYQQGFLPVIGRVLYCPDFVVSVISQSRVVKNRRLDLEYSKKHDEYSVTDVASGISLNFRPSHGLYVCKFPDAAKLPRNDMPPVAEELDDPDQDDVFAMTAEQNKMLYTKRDIQAADAARNLVKALAYPSMADMFAMIKAGISGSTVTAKDLHRALKIYGPFIPSIQGKTTRRPTPLAPEDVPKSLLTEQILHADLLFVDKVPFLISVSKPLGLTVASHLPGGKGAASVRKAMTHQIRQYAAQGFSVKTLVFDGEGAVAAIAGDLADQGVKLEPVPPGAHVGVCERKNRVIQDRFRAVKNGLWFVLPLILVRWLVYYCVSRINMLPSNQHFDLTSPKENFTGRKVDFRRDLRLSFGDYVHVHEDRAVTNTSQARTEEAIFLFPLSNYAGSGQFLSLKTKKVVSRRHYTLLPVVPDGTLDRINAIAAAERHPVPADGEALFEMENGVEVQIDQPVDPVAQEFPELEQRVHVPQILDDPSELMAADDQPHFDVSIEEPVLDEVPLNSVAREPNPDSPPVVLPPEAESRYPSRSTRTSYRDRVFNMALKKALNKHGHTALRSIYLELMQMPDKQVFTPQELRKLTKGQLRKVISSSLFLKEKYLSNGDFEKLKARLVAGGHQQNKSEYKDLSSPTVATSAAFMIASLAARESRNVVCVDIAGAYLNAEMSGQEVLMRLDRTMSAILVKIKPEYESFLCNDGTMIVRLDKALYGCVESARLWYEEISSSLLEQGYQRNPVDQCVFNKGVGAEQCTVCLHVDDLMITCRQDATIEDLLNGLTAKYKTLTVHRGKIHSYLGMTWDFSVPRKVKVTMEGFIEDTLKSYDVKGAAATPATINLFDLRKSKLLCKELAIAFHSKTAKLLYLGKRVRPDILTAIAFLTTRTRAPTLDDQGKLDRVLRYLNSTKELGMVLECDKDISVLVYVDASYGVHADGKSHTGVIISLGRGAVHVRSGKQKIVTKSSTEAELVGLSDSLSQGIWTREFILGQGYTMGPADVFQDNQSTMALAAKGRSTSDRTRHIHIRYFFVKDRVDSGEVSVKYMPTKLMLADILTKPLQGELFRAMRQELLNWE